MIATGGIQQPVMDWKSSNYEKLRVIGHGSFGEVWKAKDKRTGQIVALKVIRKSIADLEECEIWKNLKHPNIIQMIDCFETPNELVVVTECAKESLCELLGRRKTLNCKEVQQIACSLVSALHYLHDRRIFHRDIKPQNVLVMEDGTTKLCDFGFARRIGLDAYVLTSIKGTPLYMAPEVIGSLPYDHRADLWSLGCILYELLVGVPPYSTKSITELVNIVKNKGIDWPECLTESERPECLSFLQGLLEKDPNKRLTWPALLEHDYVKKDIVVLKTGEESFRPLTKALSPSQELAKEREISEKRKELMNGRRKIHDLRARAIHKPIPIRGTRGLFPMAPLPSPNKYPGYQPTTVVPNHNGFTSNGGVFLARFYPHGDIRYQGFRPQQQSSNGVESIPAALRNDEAQHLHQNPEGQEKVKDEGDSSESSCETLTSSSDSEDNTSDDGRTVILENGKSKTNLRNGDLHQDFSKLELRDGSGNSRSSRTPNNLIKSDALFILHTSASTDKPIESDEWVKFLRNTAKEAAQAPRTLCEKHFLTMIVAPLRNHLASTIVIEKIAHLLAMPFTNQENGCPDLLKNFESLYLDTKVVPNLLYACKLIVRRRRIECNNVSVDLADITASLTEEDLDGMDKCLRLICYFVHAEENFVGQFCDSVCVLQAYLILQIFLHLDKRKARLTTQTLTILSQVLRTIPSKSNVSLIEDLLLDGKSEGEELWRLLEHSNPLVLSKTLRMLIYLISNSTRIKELFLQNKLIKLMLLLRNASSHQDTEVKTAAEIIIQYLKTSLSSSNKQTVEGSAIAPEYSVVVTRALS